MAEKKCKVCKSLFTVARPLQRVCSAPCALVMARNVTEKKKAKDKAEDRKQTREKLDAMRTKPQLVKLAQTAFNAFIRARDAGKPCICCGKPLGNEPNTFDAGHYRSVGSAPHMRFVEDNVHGQAKHCNNYLGGNHVSYRQGLIERIGLAREETSQRNAGGHRPLSGESWPGRRFGVRAPGIDETPLSHAEVMHGLTRCLL